MQKKHIKKYMALAVIILFIETSLTSSIYADTSALNYHQDKPKNSNLIDSELITCSYFTKEGIEKIEKEISSLDADRLFQALEHSEIENILSILQELQLKPSDMTNQELRKLVNGRYGQEIYQNIAGKKRLFSYQNDEYLIKRNIFCTVQGSSPDHIYFTPRSIAFYGSGWIAVFLDVYLQQYSWYPTYDGYFMDLGILGFYGFGAVILAQILPFVRINPIRTAPCMFVWLETGWYDEYAYLNTTSSFSNWQLKSPFIHLTMIGFLGIWIKRMDHTNSPNCRFLGFSAFVGGIAEIEEPYK